MDEWKQTRRGSFVRDVKLIKPAIYSGVFLSQQFNHMLQKNHLRKCFTFQKDHLNEAWVGHCIDQEPEKQKACRAVTSFSTVQKKKKKKWQIRLAESIFIFDEGLTDMKQHRETWPPKVKIRRNTLVKKIVHEF